MPGLRRHQGVDAAELFAVDRSSHPAISSLLVYDATQVGKQRRNLRRVAHDVHAGVDAESTQLLSNSGDA